MEKGLAEEAVQKNRLQEYTQKSGVPLPIYQIINEGFPHEPKFRCRVLVNGNSYISRMTYPLRKQAEQDAAQLALHDINQHIENEECTILPDLKYCKSVLHEYAVKVNLESPKYTTTQARRLRPMFVSTLVFNGKRYTGQIGKCKKEAEQQAAYVAIKSLLGNSSKQPIDTPGPTVDSGHDNKRKVDSSDLGSTKAPRHGGLEAVSTPSESEITKGKAIYANYVMGRFGKYYGRRGKPNSAADLS